MIRLGSGEVADLIQLLLCPLILLYPSNSVFVQYLFKIFPLLCAATFEDLRSLSLEFFHLHLSLHLLLLFDLPVQFIEADMDWLGISNFSELLLNNFAGSVVNHGVHCRIFLESGLHFLILNLLSNFLHEIILILEELIQVTLLVALLDRVNGWLESATLKVFVCIFSLHLFNFAFTLVIELVNTASELFLVECFLEIRFKIHHDDKNLPCVQAS